jgi:Ricin-type beta-trefoil lectin domain-like
MAINVEQASLHNGASLLQWPVDQERNDNWRFESVGSGYYQILAEHSGKAINGKMYCIHKL